MFTGADDMAVLALAVLLDLALGEPPARFHPTVWMGRMVGFWNRGLQKNVLLRQLQVS